MSYMVVGIRKVKENIKSFATKKEALEYIYNKKDLLVKDIYQRYIIKPQNYILRARYINIPIKYQGHLKCGDTLFSERDEANDIPERYFETKEEALVYIKQHENELLPDIEVGSYYNNLLEYWLCSDIDEDMLLFEWKANKFNNKIIDVKRTALWGEYKC